MSVKPFWIAHYASKQEENSNLHLSIFNMFSDEQKRAPMFEYFKALQLVVCRSEEDLGNDDITTGTPACSSVLVIIQKKFFFLPNIFAYTLHLFYYYGMLKFPLRGIQKKKKILKKIH